MPQEWFVRLPDRNEIDGPLSSGELGRLASEGRLTPDGLVSPDRQKWVKASRVKGLVFQSPSSHVPSDTAGTGQVVSPSDGEETPQGGTSRGYVETAGGTAGSEKASAQAERVRAAAGNFVDLAKGLGAKAGEYAQSDEVKGLIVKALGMAKEVSSRAKKHAANLTHRAKDAGVATIPFWEELFREIHEVVVTTARQTARLIRYGFDVARTPVLLRKARSAQLTLGHRMCEAGLGDEAIRGQIASLDDRIESVGLAKGSTRVLEAEKKGLMIKLAAQALVQNTAPTGAEAEYGRAYSARDVIDSHRASLVTTKARLAPQDTTSWRRIGLGYGVVMLALTFATTLFLRSVNMPSDVSRPSMTDTTPTHVAE